MNDYKYGNWMQMTELVLDDSLMQITEFAESFFLSASVFWVVQLKYRFVFCLSPSLRYWFPLD